MEYICQIGELEEKKTVFKILSDGTPILLAYVDGTPKAFLGKCPHEQVLLDNVIFDGATVVCPEHFWEFDATSGRCREMEDACLIPRAVQVEGDRILVSPQS